MILVVGSTGILGMEICRILAEKKKDFKALVRTTSDQGKVELLKNMEADIAVGDLKELESIIAACDGIDQVISTASSTIVQQTGDNIKSVDQDGQLNLVKAAEEAGVKKFVYVSFTDNPDVDFPLTRAKRNVEKILKKSRMNWTSLWANYFMEVWLGPNLGFDFQNGNARIYGSGEAKMSWVSFRDVAKFAVHALYSPVADNAILKIGGPEALSPNEVVKLFEEVQGRSFNIEHVPVEALQQQKEAAQDPLQESFAGLMLQYAAGDPMEMGSILKEIHVDLISVRDYAMQVSAG
jgi:NADH dehydrogenase